MEQPQEAYVRLGARIGPPCTSLYTYIGLPTYTTRTRPVWSDMGATRGRGWLPSWSQIQRLYSIRGRICCGREWVMDAANPTGYHIAIMWGMDTNGIAATALSECIVRYTCNGRLLNIIRGTLIHSGRIPREIVRGEWRGDRNVGGNKLYSPIPQVEYMHTRGAKFSAQNVPPFPPTPRRQY